MKRKRVSDLTDAEKESRRDRFVEDGRGLIVIDPKTGMGRDLNPIEKPETTQ